MSSSEPTPATMESGENKDNIFDGNSVMKIKEAVSNQFLVRDDIVNAHSTFANTFMPIHSSTNANNYNHHIPTPTSSFSLYHKQHHFRTSPPHEDIYLGGNSIDCVKQTSSCHPVAAVIPNHIDEDENEVSRGRGLVVRKKRKRDGEEEGEVSAMYPRLWLGLNAPDLSVDCMMSANNSAYSSSSTRSSSSSSSSSSRGSMHTGSVSPFVAISHQMPSNESDYCNTRAGSDSMTQVVKYRMNECKDQEFRRSTSTSTSLTSVEDYNSTSRSNSHARMCDLNSSSSIRSRSRAATSSATTGRMNARCTSGRTSYRHSYRYRYNGYSKDSKRMCRAVGGDTTTDNPQHHYHYRSSSGSSRVACWRYRPQEGRWYERSHRYSPHNCYSYRCRYHQDLPLEWWERSEQCKAAKDAHTQRIDHMCSNREDLVLKTTLWRCDTALEANMFPYETPYGVEHFTLWSIADMSHDQIVAYVDAWLLRHMPAVRRWQYDDNSGERSIDLFHVHIFIEVVPYAFHVSHPDLEYLPPHAATCSNSTSNSTSADVGAGRVASNEDPSSRDQPR